MSQRHDTYATDCKTCGAKIFMRWSENKSKYYPANNEAGRPVFHNCRTDAKTQQTTITQIQEDVDGILYNTLKGIRLQAEHAARQLNPDFEALDPRERRIIVLHYEKLIAALRK